MSNNVSVPKNFLFFSTIIISSFSSMLLPCCFFFIIFFISFFLSSYYYLLPPPPIIIFFFLLVVVVFCIYYIHTTTTVFTTCTILHCYFIRNKRCTASTDWAGSIFLDRIQVISFSWAMVIVLNTPLHLPRFLSSGDHAARLRIYGILLVWPSMRSICIA